MNKVSAKQGRLPVTVKNELLRSTHHSTPLANMQSFTKLVRAYWTSDQWKQAWGYTLGVGAFIAAASQSNVWMAQYAGELMDTLSKLPTTASETPFQDVMKVGGAILGVSMAQHLALYPGKKYLLENLHRKWRGWLNRQFNDAIMNDRHTYLHLMHGIKETRPGYPAMPENIDQRWQDSLKAMTGATLGLAHGAVSVVTSAIFVTLALMQTSGKVSWLEPLGDYGTLALTFGAAAAYVPINTFVAWKMGKYLEKLTNRIEETEGSYRGELNAFMRLGFHIAASGAAKVQSKINGRLYKDVDDTWKKLITAHTGYSSFNGLYSAFAGRILAYAPGLPAYIQGTTDFKGYITGSELFTSFINDCSWLINVMPAISGLKAQYRRVADVVDAVIRVQDSQKFYRESGHSNYKFETQDPAFGMRVQNISLRHQGHDVEPFLQAKNLRFQPGQWTFVKGASGCGKSSLLRGLTGLFPYCEAHIILPEKAKILYASQDIRLLNTNLKQLICIPYDESVYSDGDVKSALEIAGLGKFAGHIHESHYEGKKWDEQNVLSGGERERIMLAQAILQRPDILLMDEKGSALDPSGKIYFYETLKKYCPDSIVISVMHDPVPPVSRNGQPFFDTLLEVRGGHARMESLIKPPKHRIFASLERTPAV